MSADEGGILGNLPRSRPGTRSEKRPEQGGRTGRPEREPRGPGAAESDPVGEAVRGAVRLAGAGLRVADGITREVLRRVPRP